MVASAMYGKGKYDARRTWKKAGRRLRAMSSYARRRARLAFQNYKLARSLVRSRVPHHLRARAEGSYVLHVQRMGQSLKLGYRGAAGVKKIEGRPRRTGQ